MTAMDCEARALHRHRERALRRKQRDQLSEECDQDEWEYIEREYRRELAELEPNFSAVVVTTADV